VLLEFYNYPAGHWVHLRTTNPIESTFATVRLRQRVTKGPGNRAAGVAMAFKLIESAQARWRAVNAPQLVPLVRAGATFKNGNLVVAQRPDPEAPDHRCRDPLRIWVADAREHVPVLEDRQRHPAAQTPAGLAAKAERDRVIGLHRDAQRLLEPLAVVNPFADRLTFADARTRTRRDHGKYLGLIAAVTLLHQHQRSRKTTTMAGQSVTYVESTLADIEVANRLAHAVLGQSLDELPPQTRRLLIAVHAWVTGEAERLDIPAGLVRFTRRQLRETLGFGDTQLKVHLARLVDLELLVVHRFESGGFGYELTWRGEGEHGGSFLLGRYIQAMLGHAELSTTQIYTQVSIRTLQAVHQATHPGATFRRHRSVDDLRGDDHVELHHGADGPDVDQLLLFSVLDQEVEEENRPPTGSGARP